MYKPVNEFTVGIRGFTNIVEDRGPKDQRPPLSFGIQFPNGKYKNVWVIIQQQMVYETCVFKHSFSIQIHKLSMDFASNERGIVILNSRGLSWSKGG